MLAMALGFQYQPIVNYDMSVRVDCDHYNWGHNYACMPMSVVALFQIH